MNWRRFPERRDGRNARDIRWSRRAVRGTLRGGAARSASREWAERSGQERPNPFVENFISQVNLGLVARPAMWSTAIKPDARSPSTSAVSAERGRPPVAAMLRRDPRSPGCAAPSPCRRSPRAKVQHRTRDRSRPSATGDRSGRTRHFRFTDTILRVPAGDAGGCGRGEARRRPRINHRVSTLRAASAQRGISCDRTHRFPGASGDRRKGLLAQRQPMVNLRELTHFPPFRTTCHVREPDRRHRGPPAATSRTRVPRRPRRPPR